MFKRYHLDLINPRNTNHRFEVCNPDKDIDVSGETVAKFGKTQAGPSHTLLLSLLTPLWTTLRINTCNASHTATLVLVY